MMNNRTSRKTAPKIAAIEDDMMYSILCVSRSGGVESTAPLNYVFN
jgi:hypothetical protein